MATRILSGNETANSIVKNVVGGLTNDLSAVVYSEPNAANYDIDYRKKNLQAFGGLSTLTRDDIAGLLRDVEGMSIEDGRPTYYQRMYGCMKWLMLVNANEKSTTLDMVGVNAAPYGNPDLFSTPFQHPTYTEGNNYTDYVAGIDPLEFMGVNTTRVTGASNGNTYVNNDIYTSTDNLYPDDLCSGTFLNKISYNCDRNSILYKTKALFTQGKLNSLISRFSTGADCLSNDRERIGMAGHPRYGMSRGRNLLTKDAEVNGISYNVNGYNNPYCRVWTHHHQYDRMSKLIRPFAVTKDGETKAEKLDDLHKWDGFSGGSENGWRTDTSRFEKSVMNNDTGLLNITPVYNEGEKTNIHTKQCMFSIENLAWKDYDPYSFEHALSWEQRGPMGGRIMWFPPYGLQFSESVTTQWTPNTFIGRGEDVHTYTNTARTGSLSFILLVDHPSSLDYAMWHQTGVNDTLSDTDLLRYFAGCDSGVLHANAKPTPLVDEYIQVTPVVDEKKNPEEVEVQPSDEESGKKVCFSVYYPNNYSGCYDYPKKSTSNVDAIAYLIAGYGAMKRYGTQGDVNTAEDIPISLDNLPDFSLARGYEMSNPGVTSGNENVIYQCKSDWGLGKVQASVYEKAENKSYHYRVDGEYSIPKGDEERIRNTYCQNFKKAESYYDKSTSKLNCEIDDSKEDWYSLTDVLYALSKENGDTSVITYLENGNLCDVERAQTVLDILQNYEVSEVRVEGYSNYEGNNVESINEKRNRNLAANRAETVKEWLVNYRFFSNGMFTTNANSGKGSAGEEKKYRRADCTITFKTAEKRETTDVNEEGNTSLTFSGFELTDRKTEDGKPIYTNSGSSQKFDYVLMKNSSTEGNTKTDKYYMVPLNYLENQEKDNVIITRATKNNDGSFNGDTNTLRYDQEYLFFKQLSIDSPITFQSLKDKVKFFNPAFHSMTPEGFNARLTFLQQCMRAGDSMDASSIDENYRSATNMSFGRPPYCVLRIGDFYNQMVIINSMTLDYSVSSGITWDLNPEGNGVQPLLCKVNLGITFIGGGEMAGPVRRLQNALSFNYYANTSLYDNRADRPEYEENYKTMGGAGNNKLDAGKSYVHTVQTYDKQKA